MVSEVLPLDNHLFLSDTLPVNFRFLVSEVLLLDNHLPVPIPPFGDPAQLPIPPLFLLMLLCVRSAHVYYGFGGPAPRQPPVSFGHPACQFFRFLVSEVLLLDNHLLSTILLSILTSSFFWTPPLSASLPMVLRLTILLWLPLLIRHPLLIQSNHQHSAGHFLSCHPLGQVELWRASVLPLFGKPGSKASVPSFQNHDGHSCGECLFYDLLGVMKLIRH